jgi:Capsule assembly protein Wzi
MRRPLKATAILFLLCSFATAAEYPQYSAFGTTYVPLDSWVYPAFDRLAALGYVPSAILGLRPWTRLECARLLEELPDVSSGDEKAGLVEVIKELRDEFSPEVEAIEGGDKRGADVESVYARSLSVGGNPLTDSYQFGQTIVNDFGRPFSEGEIFITGGSGRAFDGPFAIFVRGEYQHAPGVPAESLPIRQLISTLDKNPLQPAVPSDSVDQFRLLDTYAAVNLKNTELSFGKQSTAWGTGRSGGLLLSDNVDPVYMFRVARVTPFKLPWIFQHLGPIRTDFFMGKLSGHHFPARPWIHGEKVSLKPTPNLEFGFSRTVVFAGVGHPLTARLFYKTYFNVNDNPGGNAATRDPGDRKGGFDFSYRLPGLRKWVTLYNDALSDDDPSPVAAPRRAAMNPGLYFPQIPGVPKLDLHAEAVYTEVPGATTKLHAGQFIYWNVIYHDSYTNKGNLLGSWIGRDAIGFQAWSTYSFSARNTVLVGYRDKETDAKFIPGGGTQNDIYGQVDWWLRPDVSVGAFLQAERWVFPLLSPGTEHNFTASFEVAFHPKFQKTE